MFPDPFKPGLESSEVLLFCFFYSWDLAGEDGRVGDADGDVFGVHCVGYSGEC